MRRCAILVLAFLSANSAFAQTEPPALSAYALRPEQAQPYDPANPPRTHRIGANESLYDIATKYQIPMMALIAQNRLEPPYALSPGREIELPPPRFHTIERGQTLRDVALLYNIDPRSLALFNRLQPPYEVAEGQRIVLPAIASAREAAPSPSEPTPPPSPQPPNTSVRFVWPLRGDVVGRFGAQRGGGRLDGIEIAGREGAPIAAAGDGEVIYAGDDVAGYGALVLVRHAGNFVSAYGHGRRVTVREGERVRAGQQVAELGPAAQGRARLLFQVRQGREAVDPLPLLRR